MKKSKRIFLIEDDKDDQDIFISALKEMKDVVLSDIAENGKCALQKLKGSVVLRDIIFTDINMPVMNGIECLIEIMNNPQLRKIPVVVLSSSISQRELFFRLGAKVCIEKTYDCKILSDGIMKAINLCGINTIGVNSKTMHLTDIPNYVI
jgi:CheY-like chemotaxis protein